MTSMIEGAIVVFYTLTLIILVNEMKFRKRFVSVIVSLLNICFVFVVLLTDLKEIVVYDVYPDGVPLLIPLLVVVNIILLLKQILEMIKNEE